MFRREDVDGPCVSGPRGSGAMFTQEDVDCVKHVAKAFSVDLFPRQDGFLIERGGFSIAEDSPDEQAPTAAASASRDEAMALSRNLAVDAGFSVSTEAQQAPLAPEADSPPGFICPQVTAEGPKAYDETAKWSGGARLRGLGRAERACPGAGPGPHLQRGVQREEAQPAPLA